jgi:uncharacterized protein YidB (DUF937 family)
MDGRMEAHSVLPMQGKGQTTGLDQRTFLHLFSEGLPDIRVFLLPDGEGI